MHASHMGLRLLNFRPEGTRLMDSPSAPENPARRSTRRVPKRLPVHPGGVEVEETERAHSY